MEFPASPGSGPIEEYRRTVVGLTVTLVKCPERGWYTAICNDIRGGISEGPTIEVAIENLLDAIEGLLETDDAGLSGEDRKKVLSRLEAHHRNPASAVPLEEMNTRLRDRFCN